MYFYTIRKSKQVKLNYLTESYPKQFQENKVGLSKIKNATDITETTVEIATAATRVIVLDVITVRARSSRITAAAEAARWRVRRTGVRTWCG